MSKFRSDDLKFCSFGNQEPTKAPEQNAQLIDKQLFKRSFGFAIFAQSFQQIVKFGLRFTLQHRHFGKNSMPQGIVLTSLFALLRSWARELMSWGRGSSLLNPLVCGIVLLDLNRSGLVCTGLNCQRLAFCRHENASLSEWKNSW